MVGVAQRQLDHGQALEVMGGRQFVRHTHAAMQLNRLLAAHHFKRLTMIELSLGDSDHHLQRFIAQPGFAQGIVE
jgi:hypothetical protein